MDPLKKNWTTLEYKIAFGRIREVQYSGGQCLDCLLHSTSEIEQAIHIIRACHEGHHGLFAVLTTRLCEPT